MWVRCTEEPVKPIAHRSGLKVRAPLFDSRHALFQGSRDMALAQLVAAQVKAVAVENQWCFARDVFGTVG